MTSRAENPFRGIVDLDTFGYYVIDFTSQVMRTSPHELIPRDQWYRRFSESVSGLSSDRFLESPTPLVRIDDCPWTTVPPSLQEIIGQQYPSANQPSAGNRSVDVTVSRRDIIFGLHNNFVDGRVDSFGEEYVGRGLLLLFGMEPDDAILKRGEWRIARFPMSLYARSKYEADHCPPPPLHDPAETIKWMENEAKKMTEYLDQLREIVKGIPATVPQLQNIVSFLEGSKERAKVLVPAES